MKYLCQISLFLFTAILPPALLAQTPLPPATQTPTDPDTTKSKRVKILHADFLTFKQSKDQDPIQKLIGKVRMQQDSTLFFCDSAYFYENVNRVEAFSKVRIEMQDGVTLTGDKMEYDGDTKIAKVKDRIELRDGEVTLNTDIITYYREKKYGYYEKGGILKDRENTLTSQTGHYYSEQDMAYFRNAVRLENPDYVLETDTLGYNTETEEAFFLTYTTIVSEDGEMETTRGRYDTKNEFIHLVERSTVLDSTYTLSADTLMYDDKADIGLAWGNVVIEQDSSLTVLGEHGRFHRRIDQSIITKDAVAIQTMEDDTLYMFADTLLYFKDKKLIEPAGFVPLALDSLGNPLPDSLQPALPAIDSLTAIQPDSTLGPAPMDTLEFTVFRAYHNVTFFMNDLQGKADSLVYFYDDSIITLHDDPILWSDVNQLTGDTIKIWMKNDQVDSMWVGADGFLASKEDTVGYNQIKGKELRVKFRNNELSRMNVIGNSESIYFARNDDDTTRITYQGMNKALAQKMVMHFEDNEPVKIVFLSQPEGKFIPFFMTIGQENKLDGLDWRIEEKPEKPRLFDPTVPALPAVDEDPTDQPATDQILPPGIIPQSNSAAAPQDGQKR